MTGQGSGGSLRDHVYDSLRKRIVEVDLRPGERIIERDLAAELGVSRVPVREALRLLAAEGLVIQVPRRGALVSPFTEADVRDLYDIREYLEVLAARLAAERAGAEGLARLRGHLDRAEAAIETGDEQQIATHNVGFHAEIVELSGNALLTSLMRPLEVRLHWLFRLASQHDPRQQCAEHEELFAAIADGDPGRAGVSALRHVLSGREPTLELARRWATGDVDPAEVTRTRRRTRPATTPRTKSGEGSS